MSVARDIKISNSMEEPHDSDGLPSTTKDDHINASGHVQEMNRNFSLLSIAGVGLVVDKSFQIKSLSRDSNSLSTQRLACYWWLYTCCDLQRRSTWRVSVFKMTETVSDIMEPRAASMSLLQSLYATGQWQHVSPNSFQPFLAVEAYITGPP